MYLGENYARVVCEKVWRNLKKCAIQGSLAIGSHDWQVARMAHVRSTQGEGHDSWSTIGENFQSGQAVSSQLKLETHSSHKVKSSECLVWLKLTFRIPHTPYYKYPYTHEM